MIRSSRSSIERLSTLGSIHEEDNATPIDPRVETLEKFKEWVRKNLDHVRRAVRELNEDNKDIRDENTRIVNAHNELAEWIERLKREKTDWAVEKAELTIEVAGLNAVIRYQIKQIEKLQKKPAEDSSSSSTPLLIIERAESNKANKTIKLSDPPIFIDNKDLNIDDWLSMMRSKLKVNADDYSIESLRKAYVETRVEGDASRHIASRLRKNARNPFAETEDIFDCLLKIYGDSDRKHTAMKEFRNLCQTSKDFNFFWAHFQRLAAELDYNENTLIEELRHNIFLKLKKELVNEDDDPTDLYKFARRCQRIDQRLRDLELNQTSRFQSFASSSSLTSRTTAPVSKIIVITEPENEATQSASSRLSPFSFSRRTPHPDARKKELMRERRCFHCQEHGHTAKVCPKKEVAVQEMKVETKNLVPSGKE